LSKQELFSDDVDDDDCVEEQGTIRFYKLQWVGRGGERDRETRVR